jgi:hypothetical protein
VLVSRTLPVLPDSQRSVGLVDMFPFEPERFALAKSEGHCHDPAGTVALFAGDFQKSLDFFDGVRFRFLVCELGCLASGTGFRPRCPRSTASLSAFRIVRWTWCAVPAASPLRCILA